MAEVELESWSYIKGMVEDHQQDIEGFPKRSQLRPDPDARKAYAAATLPTLEAHLKRSVYRADSRTTSVCIKPRGPRRSPDEHLRARHNDCGSTQRLSPIVFLGHYWIGGGVKFRGNPNCLESE